jgi:hypothetical protein
MRAPRLLCVKSAAADVADAEFPEGLYRLLGRSFPVTEDQMFRAHLTRLFSAKVQVI